MKDIFNYIKKLDETKDRIPDIKNIVSYVLTNIGDEYSIRFKYNDIIINVNMKGNTSFQISNNEILSLLRYYNVLDQLKSIDIRGYKQPGIQGMVTRTEEKELPYFLMLTIPDEIFKKSYKNKSDKWLAMFVLLHEISHLMGNVTDDRCEQMADDFADMEIVKWQKIMKF